MRVSRLRLTQVRCYARADVAFADGVTAIVGPNGAGKTSLLEAVHLALVGHSPRTSNDLRCIQDGTAFLRVEADGTVRGAAHAVTLALSPSEQRRVTLDGRSLRSREELDQWWTCLVFLPDRLAVVKRAPAVRRAYLDRATSRLEPAHLAEVAGYVRALAQRNALLRRIRAGVAAPATLDVWDELLARHGALVMAGRARTCDALAPRFSERLAALGGAAPGTLRYRTRAPEGEHELLAALHARRATDIARAASGLGPHLDDVALLERDRDLRSYGSQGEQRTAVLALLLAEASLVIDRRGERPILLLDDVLSELDVGRRRLLIETVRAHGQALVTATEVAHLPEPPDGVLVVEAGTIGPLLAG
jgi:DNA replication and repair protein RecF